MVKWVGCGYPWYNRQVMKLSQERQLFVESLFNGKLKKLSPKYRSEIERIKSDFWPTKADRKRELIKAHSDHIEELRTFAVDAYLSAYRAEGEIPDYDDIGEIASKLSYWLRKEIADCVSHLSLDLALPTETERLMNDAQENTERDLRNAKMGHELNSKREQEKKMEQKAI